MISMGVSVQALLILLVSGTACAVDLQMTPPVVRVYDSETFQVKCVVTGEYQPQYHTIHLVHHTTTGQKLYLTNDETLSHRLDSRRQSRYTIVKKTFGSGANARWEFILTIAKASRADVGRYQCARKESSSSNVQHSTVLTRVFVNAVIPASAIAPQCALSPPNPKPGQQVTFSCFSIGEAPKLSLTWAKGRTVLTSKSNNSTGKFNVVTFQRALTDWDNNATFTCTASGVALGQEIRTCSVVPFVIPTNVTVTSIQRVKPGDPAEFICLAAAVPAANRYVWIVSKGERKFMIERSNGRFRIEQGGALLRVDSVVSSDHNSSVQCIAMNDMNIEGGSTGTLLTVPTTTPSGPGTKDGGSKGGGIGNRKAKGDGNFVFYGSNGAKGLTPHPGVLPPNRGDHDVRSDGFLGPGRPNIPLLIGGTLGFLVFMSLVVFLLAVVFRSRTQRQREIRKKSVINHNHHRPVSIVSMNAAIDLEKADVALVRGNTLAKGQTLSRTLASRASRVSRVSRKSAMTLPAISAYRKSVAATEVSRQQLADKLAATLRTKSYVSLLSTPLPDAPAETAKPIKAAADDDDCVSRVSTCADSAFDELTCSMTSTALGSRTNSNATTSPMSCYGSAASLPGSVKYNRIKDQVDMLRRLNPELMYAEIDWSNRKPPSGQILDADDKTLYAKIRKKKGASTLKR